MTSTDPLDAVATPTVRLLVTSDGDELLSIAPAVSGQLVRTGRGRDDAAMTTVNFGSAHLSVVDVGFPIAGEGESRKDMVALFTVLRAPSWINPEGSELSAGRTVVYPPGALRHARDPAGVLSASTVVPVDAFESAAMALGLEPDLGTRPHVIDQGPLWAQLAPLAKLSVADGSAAASAAMIDAHALIEHVVMSTCERAALPSNPPKRWDDGDLVQATADHLEIAGEWIVPMLTLCRHIGVSERRLQIAFKNRLGVSPNAFMRYRALQHAHRRLRGADATRVTVSHVARDSGFWHLGRFTAYYRAVYGETPSRTLRRTSS